MLVFQVNQNELKEDLKSADWLFWNQYLAQRVKEDDYCLLPPYIDYIQDTNLPQECEQVLVELEDDNT